ncbi:hypothetical protein HJU46_14865 [Clostridium butyricum]|nr:hypothetical protein [Clostridium butyricum]
MKINFNAEVDNIKNDDEYFYVLGQISRFICDEIEKQRKIANRIEVDMFLRNSKNDYEILRTIKLKLRVISNRSLNDLESRRFQRCLYQALEYNSVEEIKECKGAFFDQGFFAQSIFRNK